MQSGTSDSKNDDGLLPDMKRLARAVEKSVSFRRTFFLAIVRGFGMAIGATVVTAVALTILWRVVKAIGIEDVARSFGALAPESAEQNPGIGIPAGTDK